MNGKYPVVEEVSLPPVERRRFRAIWRDPATLPKPEPGSVYVFEYDGRYQDPYSRRVHGGEPHVVEATAVSLVQTRDRLITVRRSMPSNRPGINLVVRATFRCVVTDPVIVAGGGLTDLESVLATHVAADRELATLGRHVRPERAAEAVLRVEAQLRAHCTVNPPDVLGIECVVAQVEVHPESITGTETVSDGDAPIRAVGTARPQRRERAVAAGAYDPIPDTASMPAPEDTIVTTEIPRSLLDEAASFAERITARRTPRQDEDTHAR